jgi:hypothetical protein
MIKYLNNILKSSVLVGLIAVLLTPSVLNLIHSFEHEKHHIECSHKSDTHLHEIDFDCSFIQLYATPQFYTSNVNWSVNSLPPVYSFTNSYYFCKNVATIHIYNTPYRGPPVSNS